MKTIRLLHLYLGTFIAPSLLFFALTGAIQTLGLHEARRGSGYQPATWIKMLAQVHKHQTMELPQHRPALPDQRAQTEKPKAEAPLPAKTDDAHAEHSGHKSPWPLKIFFLFVCFGLAFTTLLGLYMSFTFNRNKKLVTLLLVLGVIVPVALLLL